jgi:non-specific serine/threonine protein kinase
VPDLGGHRAAEAVAARTLRIHPIGGTPALDIVAAPPVRADAKPWPYVSSQPLTRFIGRHHEIARARKLLGGTRLLTLTGTGGVGKTRLGQEIAAGLLDRFEDGVWVVELAALTDPALVPQAVATVLGVRQSPDRPVLRALADRLRAAQLLLVLDNCEHLIEACAGVADLLLRACPELRVLATSCQPLGIAGEMTFRVPSLSLSAAREGSVGAPSCADGAPPSEAALLFVERARAAVPGFVLTPRNAAAVERICQRLDGIPLAIELAAARVGVLAPDQIADRLGDRFSLLTGGSRTALPRYRTLRALVDWSYDLLDEQERILFRRLAVFAGNWTLEAVESVCAGDGIEPDDVLDLLSALVTRSLVDPVEHGDNRRYRFQESLQAYASEKLSDAGEEAQLRRRHALWHVAFAEQAEPRLSGQESVPWLDLVERERDNLRAALAWCIDHGEAALGMRLGGSLARFWGLYGPYGEMRGTLATLLRLPSAQQPAAPTRAARAKALYAAGFLAVRQGDCGAAAVLFEELAEIGRLDGDRRSLAIGVYSRGTVLRFRASYREAERLYMEARQIFRELDEPYWLAQTELALGVTAFFQEDLATARRYYESGLALFQALGDEPGIVGSLNDLGEVLFLTGKLDEASSTLRTSLTMARALDDKERIAMNLAALGGVAAVRRAPTRALKLAAAAIAVNEGIGHRHSPAWHAMIERWQEPARQALRPADAAAASVAGRAMPLDDAITVALADDGVEIGVPDTTVSPTVVTAFGPAAGAAPQLRPGRDTGHPRPPLVASPRLPGLTQREQEVAALVAQGMTNRQIAEALVITEGTAANHVKHILARLVLDSRVQIATWAIERGLHRHATAV